MSTEGNNRQNWIKWAITTVIALISIAVVIIINLGGSMETTYQARRVRNGESNTIMVCMDDASTNLSDLNVTPTFKNNSWVSLKHLSLSFEVECTNISFMPSVFVNAHKYNESNSLFQYKDKELSAHDDSKPPFSNIIINSSTGWCLIKSKASFDGKSAAFKCYTYVYFFVVPNNDGLTYANWKKKCEDRFIGFINSDSFDVCYYSMNRKVETLLNVSHDNFVTSSTEKNVFEKEKEATSQNDNSKSNKNEPTVYELKNNWGIKYCQISRKDSTLTYRFTFEPNNLVPGVYMFEARHGNNSKQYEHFRLRLSGNEISKDCSIVYRYHAVPEIDQIKIYQQSVNDDVMEVKKRGRYYIVKNKTDYVIVLFVTYNTNGAYYIYELAGGKQRTLDDIGVSPIEVFKTDRKK